MRSAARGKPTSEVEITNLSKHGFWILIQGRELFASFESFPWFRDVRVGQILNVEMPGKGHLYWPELDVDLAVDSIENPEAFPLLSRARPQTPQRPPRRAGNVKRGRGRSGGARG